MSPRTVVIVGETPSLGRSVGDLLLSEGISCRIVSDLSPRELEAGVPGEEPLILVACNEAYCRTARQWARGEFRSSGLIVIGARDPELKGMRGARIVPLPVQRELLLALLQELLSEGLSSARCVGPSRPL